MKMAKSETLSETRPGVFEQAWKEYNLSGNADGWEKVVFTSGFGKGFNAGIEAGRLQGLEEAAKKLDFDGHTCNTPNYTDGPCYACAKEKVMEWVFERYENCLRIADDKIGTDRAGWLKDADHFMLILQLLRGEGHGKG